MLLDFIKEQFFTTMLPPAVKSLKGRTVIVTGSNIGLGLSAAIHLAKLSPAHLILAVRDVVKGEEAAKQVKAAVPNDSQDTKVEVWDLDLSSFKSVQAFAKRMNELERLDILLENAGVASFNWNVTEDKFEQTIQVNCLSTGLLAILALPLLEKTATLPNPTPEIAFKPHLTIVGSEVHFWAKYAERKAPGPALEALNNKELWVPRDRYNISKLLDLFITRKIATLPSASEIIVSVVNPGLCVSNLRKEMNPIVGYLLDSAARTTDVGALNLSWAATADTSTNPGAYISSCAVKTPSSFSTSKEGLALEEKIWGEMVELWKSLEPEVVKKVIG